jgi:hypothetical protein
LRMLPQTCHVVLRLVQSFSPWLLVPLLPGFSQVVASLPLSLSIQIRCTR